LADLQNTGIWWITFGIWQENGDENEFSRVPFLSGLKAFGYF
jgi:hypothetical protein